MLYKSFIYIVNMVSKIIILWLFGLLRAENSKSKKDPAFVKYTETKGQH